MRRTLRTNWRTSNAIFSQTTFVKASERTEWVSIWPPRQTFACSKPTRSLMNTSARKWSSRILIRRRVSLRRAELRLAQFNMADPLWRPSRLEGGSGVQVTCSGLLAASSRTKAIISPVGSGRVGSGGSLEPSACNKPERALTSTTRRIIMHNRVGHSSAFDDDEDTFAAKSGYTR